MARVGPQHSNDRTRSRQDLISGARSQLGPRPGFMLMSRDWTASGRLALNIADVRLSRQAETATPTADVTVVGGAGHVGIPLVLSFAASGLTVNVNDINEPALETLKAGRLPFIEHGAEPLLEAALRDKRLIFTNSPSEISQAGPVIITIGTPVDEFHG
jgi:UDP-glucose/GDP-mannose dehydrogenase family, NAD binding domain